jgi:hypothetical protein
MPPKDTTRRRRARPRPVDDDVMTALAVYTPGPNGHGTVCLGFIFPRGKSGFEGFDRDDRSIGLFSTPKAAADAITEAAQ